MKLKTLKDLRKFNDDEGYNALVDGRELKAEAVKWVKHYIEDENDMDRLVIMHWIKYFFNITEEDLK